MTHYSREQATTLVIETIGTDSEEFNFTQLFPVTAKTTTSELDIDSLDIVELILALEEAFEIGAIEDYGQYKAHNTTVKDLVDAVIKELDKQGRYKIKSRLAA